MMASSSSFFDHETKQRIISAAVAGDLQSIKRVIKDFENDEEIGKKLEEVRDDTFGRNALLTAAAMRHLDVCKFLVEELHFNVNEQDVNGYTALDVSIINKDYVTSCYLLNHGAHYKIHVKNVKNDNDLIVIERLVELKMKGNKSNATKLLVEDLIEDKRHLHTMALKAKDFSKILRLHITSYIGKWLEEHIKEVGEILAVSEDGYTLLAYDLDLKSMWDFEFIKSRGESNYSIEGGGLLDFINNHQLNEGDKISFYTKYIPVFGPIFVVGFTRKELTLDEVKQTNAILNPNKKVWEN